MKKLSIVLLCLLLCGCSMIKTEPDSIRRPTADTTVGAIHESPTETEPTDPPHADFYDPDICVDDLITWFSEVNFDAEMVHGGDPGVIQKWEVPIYYYVFGAPTDEDLKTVDSFVQWVNTVEGFPGMAQTTDLGQANMKLYFCDNTQLQNIMGPGFEGLDGAVTYWYDNNIIYDATICIRTDLTQHLRNSVIKEEFYNGLGPINDTYLRQDSIIYANFSEPQELTAADELIMKLLYSPEIQCGMTMEQCTEIIQNLYY